MGSRLTGGLGRELEGSRCQEPASWLQNLRKLVKTTRTLQGMGLASVSVWFRRG